MADKARYMVISLAGIDAVPSQGTLLSCCAEHGLVASDSLGIQGS